LPFGSRSRGIHAPSPSTLPLSGDCASPMYCSTYSFLRRVSPRVDPCFCLPPPKTALDDPVRFFPHHRPPSPPNTLFWKAVPLLFFVTLPGLRTVFVFPRLPRIPLRFPFPPSPPPWTIVFTRCHGLQNDLVRRPSITPVVLGPLMTLFRGARTRYQ